jgi:hypothetical protein
MDQRLQALGRLVRKAGPYVLLELALPGGTMFALLLLLYRRGHLRFLRIALRTAGDVGRRIAHDLERESLTWKTAPVWPVTMNH